MCDHLQDNEDYYSSFLTSNSVLYSNEVSLLRTAGTWTNELSDALPLALANSLSITVRIYSSSVNQPVITIVPSLVEQVDNELLTLAYLRAPNCEHYDPVVPRKTDMSSGNEPDGCYILSDRETSENPEHGTGSLRLRRKQCM